MEKISNIGFSRKSMIFEGILLFISGIFFIIYKDDFPKLIIGIYLIYLLFSTFLNIFLNFFRTENKDSFFVSVLKFIFVFILLSINIGNLTIYTFVVFMSIYQILLAIINIITYILYLKNGVKPRWIYLRDFFINILFGLSGLLKPVENTDGQLFLLGIYLFLLGFSHISDGIFFNVDRTRKDFKRKFRRTLPIFLGALIPVKTLLKINNFISKNSEIDISSAYNQEKIDKNKIDLEVLVHISDNGKINFGHIDICYKGEIICYGIYDQTSVKLFGSIGDGVLFKVPKEEYIKFCQKESQKVLFGYGIYLDEEQKKLVEERIKEIDDLLIPWIPIDTEFKQKDGTFGKMYSYKLFSETSAKFFKFKKSKFKTYFVLNTNCVLLADSIIGKAGTDILSSKGFITPGTYQNYLDMEFEKKNSIVVSKIIYK